MMPYAKTSAWVGGREGEGGCKRGLSPWRSGWQTHPPGPPPLQAPPPSPLLQKVPERAGQSQEMGRAAPPPPPPIPLPARPKSCPHRPRKPLPASRPSSPLPSHCTAPHAEPPGPSNTGSPPRPAAPFHHPHWGETETWWGREGREGEGGEAAGWQVEKGVSPGGMASTKHSSGRVSPVSWQRTGRKGEIQLHSAQFKKCPWSPRPKSMPVISHAGQSHFGRFRVHGSLSRKT